MFGVKVRGVASYTIPQWLVDPTGLKPAPHGLKGRRSVSRAPGQKIGCGGRIRTFAWPH